MLTKPAGQLTLSSLVFYIPSLYQLHVLILHLGQHTTSNPIRIFCIPPTTSAKVSAAISRLQKLLNEDSVCRVRVRIIYIFDWHHRQ